MALLADRVAQTDHFAAVVHAVVIQILKDFPPLELGFVGDISQLLPQALFDHPHKHAVALVFVTLFVAAGKLLEVALDRRNHRLDLALRQIAGADDFSRACVTSASISRSPWRSRSLSEETSSR